LSYGKWKRHAPDINPPIAKADFLKKPSRTLINVILQGQSGEVVVNSKKYNALMPAQDYLSDEQIADVLNYIRNSWGNKIPGTITPASVKALRK
jgi:nitrite reductase (NO-forming)